MHVITVTSMARLLVDSHVVLTDDPFDHPHLRLRLRTQYNRGVILDLDPDAFDFLTDSLRQMQATYRAAERRLINRSRHP